MSRADARKSLDAAQAHLTSKSLQAARYAALELRLAIEFIIYERAKAYIQDIPPSAYETWQPKQLLDLLIAIEPNIASGATIGFAREEVPGVEPQEVQIIGTESVLSLRTVKKHYHALGHYLHAPTLRQQLLNHSHDFQSLSKHCEAVVHDVQAVLNSSVWNLNFSIVVHANCLRCSEPMPRRLSPSLQAIDVVCFRCNAPHRITDEGDGKTAIAGLRSVHACPSGGCEEPLYLWEDEMHAGHKWTCTRCEITYHLGLRAFPETFAASL